jgi:NAD(P)-dependent dehydrogenase (short-subunit alcohol dehydrogenase family)
MAGMVLAAELDSDPSASERRHDVSILSYEPGTVDTPMQAHARAQSAAILPSVELFRRFAADRQLVSPNAPAREIVAFLESGPTARFHERRLA